LFNGGEARIKIGALLVELFTQIAKGGVHDKLVLEI
jgi:hypothetical protein